MNVSQYNNAKRGPDKGSTLYYLHLLKDISKVYARFKQRCYQSSDTHMLRGDLQFAHLHDPHEKTHACAMAYSHYKNAQHIAGWAL